MNSAASPPATNRRHRVTAPEDFRIPTLEEALARFPHNLINMELKPDLDGAGNYEQQMANLLRRYGRFTDLIAASFVDEAANNFKAVAPCVYTSVPLDQGTVLVFGVSRHRLVPARAGTHHLSRCHRIPARSADGYRPGRRHSGVRSDEPCGESGGAGVDDQQLRGNAAYDRPRCGRDYDRPAAAGGNTVDTAGATTRA